MNLPEKDAFYFDVPLEEEIKLTENRLKELKSKAKEVVFHCPRCKKDYRSIMNYNQLKMCGTCYVEVETAKLQAKTKDLVGAIIQAVEVSKVTPYGDWTGTVGIKKLTVKLSDGKIIELLQEQPVLRL